MKDRGKRLHCACADSVRQNLGIQIFFMDKASGPVNISFFSFSCGLSTGVTQIMNIKAEKFDIFIFTSKHMDR